MKNKILCGAFALLLMGGFPCPGEAESQEMLLSPNPPPAIEAETTNQTEALPSEEVDSQDSFFSPEPLGPAAPPKFKEVQIKEEAAVSFKEGEYKGLAMVTYREYEDNPKKVKVLVKFIDGAKLEKEVGGTRITGLFQGQVEYDPETGMTIQNISDPSAENGFARRSFIFTKRTGDFANKAGDYSDLEESSYYKIKGIAEDLTSQTHRLTSKTTQGGVTTLKDEDWSVTPANDPWKRKVGYEESTVLTSYKIEGDLVGAPKDWREGINKVRTRTEWKSYQGGLATSHGVEFVVSTEKEEEQTGKIEKRIPLPNGSVSKIDQVIRVKSFTKNEDFYDSKGNVVIKRELITANNNRFENYDGKLFSIKERFDYHDEEDRLKNTRVAKYIDQILDKSMRFIRDEPVEMTTTTFRTGQYANGSYSITERQLTATDKEVLLFMDSVESWNSKKGEEYKKPGFNLKLDDELVYVPFSPADNPSYHKLFLIESSDSVVPPSRTTKVAVVNGQNTKEIKVKGNEQMIQDYYRITKETEEKFFKAFKDDIAVKYGAERANSMTYLTPFWPPLVL